VNAEQEADVIPTEDGAEARIKFVEKERVGHGEDAMTMGLTLRRTARRINRLNGARMLILSGYAAQPHSQTPNFLALSKISRISSNPAWTVYNCSNLGPKKVSG
jgi:hypothetical protein